MSDKIVCPNCKSEIEITEALSSQLSGKIRKELEADVSRRQQELDSRENSLKTQEQDVEKARQAVDQQVQDRLAQERLKVQADAKMAAEQAVAVSLKDKDAQINEISSQLKQANENELALRKKERELDQKAQSLELEVARTLDQERTNIQQAARKQADEDNALKVAEKDKQISDMVRQIEDLKRRAEQGSQQLQGEVLELVLEDFLRESFPADEITPVPKGVHGGDVVQRVRDSSGAECGLILWESKRTKNWSDGWLPKLRDDQRTAKATQAVILTEAMPSGCKTFTSVEGIWITNRVCLVGVAAAIRTTLIEVAAAGRAVEGRHTKMEVLYNYLAGIEFRNRVTGIVEAFVGMQTDLDGEKRAMQRIWSKREKQLERAVVNTTGFYGDLQGIIGGNLAQIEALNLPALESSQAEDGQA